MSRKIIKESIVVIVFIVLTFLVFNQFMYRIKVISGSMAPTIATGDEVVVTPLYTYKNLKRGDILVFSSDELHENLIKRLIGLPGDTIEITENGSVFVNNQELKEPYVKQNGGKGGTFVVPEGQYFFLGDNRPISLDSRYWEHPFISAKALKAKAHFVIYPFNKARLLQ